MTTKEPTFEQKGNEVVKEAGRLEALTSELKRDTENCKLDRGEAEGVIASVIRIALSVFGIGAHAGK
jgi:hypothetical protein